MSRLINFMQFTIQVWHITKTNSVSLLNDCPLMVATFAEVIHPTLCMWPACAYWIHLAPSLRPYTSIVEVELQRGRFWNTESTVRIIQLCLLCLYSYTVQSRSYLRHYTNRYIRTTCGWIVKHFTLKKKVLRLESHLLSHAQVYIYPSSPQITVS